MPRAKLSEEEKRLSLLKRQEYRKNYYLENKERIQAYKKQWCQENPDKRRENAAKLFLELKTENYGKYLLKTSKARAKKSGIEHSITIEDIVIPTYCPILLLPLQPSTGGSASPNSPSLDRVDNSLGYVPGNVRVISHRANSNKGSMTIEEIERMYLYAKGEL